MSILLKEALDGVLLPTRLGPGDAQPYPGIGEQPNSAAIARQFARDVFLIPTTGFWMSQPFGVFVVQSCALASSPIAVRYSAHSQQ